MSKIVLVNFKVFEMEIYFWEVLLVHIGERNPFVFTEIATFKLSNRNPN